MTLNPAVDLSATVDRLEPERKLRCQDLRRDPGGGGVNVARVIHRLGGKVLAVFAAGGTNGARLQALLSAERVPSHVIPIPAETRENFTARDLSSGEQYRFVMPGPTLGTSDRRRIQAEVDALAPAWSILVASGGLPPGIGADTYGRLARRVKAAGARLVLDASGPALQAGIAAGAWLVKPNLRELEGICGRRLPDEASRLAACRSILVDGGAEIVALSLSREGALLVSEGGAWRAPPLDIQPQSTVGAGDSFLAGLVWALAAGKSCAEALRWATAAASATLLAPGTGLCRRADVLRLHRLAHVELALESAPAPG